MYLTLIMKKAISKSLQRSDRKIRCIDQNFSSVGFTFVCFKPLQPSFFLQRAPVKYKYLQYKTSKWSPWYSDSSNLLSLWDLNAGNWQTGSTASSKWSVVMSLNSQPSKQGRLLSQSSLSLGFFRKEHCSSDTWEGLPSWSIRIQLTARCRMPAPHGVEH